jgi:hypothetical protein
MNQPVTPTSQPFSYRCFLLVRHFGWLGSLSLLSSGMALAQPAAQDATVPEPPPLPELIPAPVPIAPTAAHSVPSAPELVVPEFSTTRPITEPARVQSRSQTVEGYDAPASIVLTERSTGCQAVLRSGQVVSHGLCADLSQVAVRGSGGSSDSLAAIRVATCLPASSVSIASIAAPSPCESTTTAQFVP